MEERIPFSVDAMVNGRIEQVTVIPQEENFVIVSDEVRLLTICFNCDYDCTCTGAENVDPETVQSIANAISLHYILRENKTG